jgi:hypothetical protein
VANATDQAAEQVKVWLGNRAPVEVVDDLDAAGKMSAAQLAEQGTPRIRRAIPVKKAATYLAVEPGLRLFDAIRDITKLWPHMSDAAAPAWVASTNPRLAELLAEHWDDIEVREPENPDEQHGPYVLDDAGKGA